MATLTGPEVVCPVPCPICGDLMDVQVKAVVIDQPAHTDGLIETAITFEPDLIDIGLHIQRHDTR